jgi:hypothetical protein
LNRLFLGITRFWRDVIMLKASDWLVLCAAFLSLLMSVALWFGVLGAPDREAGMFVGLWVPSILGVGLYFALRGGRR